MKGPAGEQALRQKDTTPVCTQCGLPAGFHGWTVGKEGLCPLCAGPPSNPRPPLPPLPTPERAKALFDERLAHARRSAGVQCLVGLSGGKDSSWLALHLVRDLGLCVVAVTFDNGFLTPLARQNIEHIVRELDLEHHWIRPDPAAYKKVWGAALREWGQPCLACTLPCAMALHKFAFERDIPLIIHGRSPWQLFKEYHPLSQDAFIPFIASNLAQRSEERIKAASLAALEKARRLFSRILPKGSLREQFLADILPDLSTWRAAAQVPELAGIFLYEPYDEEAIKARLEAETSWQRASDDELLGHGDCAIHDAAAWITTRVQGLPVLGLELATARRMGGLSPEQAVERLAADASFRPAAPRDLGILLEHCGLTEHELPAILARARRRQNLLRQLSRLRAHLKGALKSGPESGDETDNTSPVGTNPGYSGPSAAKAQTADRQEWRDKTPLRYANCWEDADTLLARMGPLEGKNVVSIASAGDNSFSLLAAGAARVTAIDLNPVQIQLCELKKAALRTLSYEELLVFLGAGDSTRRARIAELWPRVREALPPASARWWDQRKKTISRGVLHAGRFEGYFRLFRRLVLPLVWSRRDRERVFTLENREERAAHFDGRLNTKRWRALFSLFFSQGVMARTGREKAYFRYASGSLPALIEEGVRRAFVDNDPKDNPWLSYILRGTWRESLPPWLRPAAWARIKESLENIRFEVKSLETLLDEAKADNSQTIDAWNLSNVFEYLDEESFCGLRTRILAETEIGGRLVYWNMMVVRVPDERQHEAEDRAALKGAGTFFYRDLVSETKGAD